MLLFIDGVVSLAMAFYTWKHCKVSASYRIHYSKDIGFYFNVTKRNKSPEETMFALFLTGFFLAASIFLFLGWIDGSMPTSR